MKVTHAMTQPLLQIPATISALDAAKIMADAGVNSLAVTSHEKIIGIITHDDVLQIKRKRHSDTQVKELVSEGSMRTIGQDFTCEDAVKLMIVEGIRKFLIVDSVAMIGTFTLSDLIKCQ
jgi:predicted transcriptional regulator